MSFDDETLKTINETKLLGVIVNDTLTWDSNTKFIVKRAIARVRLLHKLVEFSIPTEDLISIYILYIRSVLEQSCKVWHISFSFCNLTGLEREQKNALKIILKDDYIDYEISLKTSKLDSLVEPRERLCLEFAKACTKNETVKDIFPLNPLDYHV